MSALSSSFPRYPTVHVIDPRINVQDRAYTVLSGAKQVTYKPVTTTSFSSSSAQFSAPPPSPLIYVDRKVYSRHFVDLVATGGNFKLGLADALRSYPISSITDVLQVQVNNTQVSINQSDSVHEMMKYGVDKSDRCREFSLFPSMPDSFINYSDWSSAAPVGGSNKNPLAGYGENDAEPSRGGFPVQVIAPNHLRYVITEPLFISPLIWGSDDQQAMTGIQTFDITFNYKSDLSYIWSHDSVNGDAISSIAVTFYQAPQLLFTYLSPPDIMPRFPTLSYSYNNIERFPTNYGVLAGGSSDTMISNNIQLNQIPKRMLLFARRRNADQTFNTTNTWARINSVNITWNNQNGLLSSATEQDLYNMAVRNGACDYSYPQWHSYVGGVLAVDWGVDLGLSPVESVSLLGNYQLQVNMNVTNLDSASINFDFYIVIYNEGIFTISNQQSIPQLGILTKQEVLATQNAPQMDYNEAKRLSGGNVFGRLKSFVNFGSKIGRAVAPALGVPEAAPIFSGIEALTRGSGLVGGARRRRRRRRRYGGDLMGGDLISRNELKGRSNNEVEEYSD